MKKLLLVTLLAVAINATAQTTPADPNAQQQPAQPGAQDQPAQGQQKKEIKDPGEFNAYMEPIQSQDPQQKIMGLEAFLQRYPNSVVREDAMEALMGAYQQTGNWPKTLETAQKLVQAYPNNLGGLAILAYSARQNAAAGQNPEQNVQQARQYGEQGLRAVQAAKAPEGVSPADFEKRKQQLATIFNGAVGFAALQAKQYDVAQQHLRAAVQSNPNDFLDNYQLALAYLSAPEPPQQPGATEPAPNPNMVQGLWFIARAVNLAPAGATRQQVEKYGTGMYRRYAGPGKEQGWSQLLAQTRTTPMPPEGFNIQAYSKADAAAELANSKPVKDMSMDEWELILRYADPAVAEKVWAQIKSLGKVAFIGKVIEAEKTSLSLAGTAEAIQDNRINVVVEMAGPIPANLMPKVGADQAVQATPVSYEPNPFMMTMSDGVLVSQKKPVAPARRPPARRRR